MIKIEEGFKGGIFAEEIKEFDKKDFDLIRNMVGLKLDRIFPQVDMFVLGFCHDNMSYALHTYSLLRVRKGKEILMTNNDVFFRPDHTHMTNEEYDRDEKHEKSLSKVTCEKVKEILRDALVKEVEISDTADITIEFDNGVVIENITDSLWKDTEYYRFFAYKNKSIPHYVVKYYDGKIMLEKHGIDLEAYGIDPESISLEKLQNGPIIIE